jgi:hypothetical protein
MVSLGNLKKINILKAHLIALQKQDLKGQMKKSICKSLFCVLMILGLIHLPNPAPGSIKEVSLPMSID